MAQTSANALVARTGAIYVGVQADVAAPTSHSSALDADFKDLGYISSDGIEEQFETNSESITAFQNGDTIDSSVTEATMSFKATLIEAGNASVIKQFYAATVDTSDGSILISPGATAGRHAVVIDVISGTKYVRYWVPEAEFTKDGGPKYENGQVVGYPVVITCYPSASLVNGSGVSCSAKRWSSQLVVTP